MADHEELVAEFSAVEKMPTADRLKHARKKRIQQLKKYAQYEKQLEKEQLKKSGASSGSSSASGKKLQLASASRSPRPSTRGNVRFVSNVILLEAATRNDVDEEVASGQSADAAFQQRKHDEVRQLLESGTSPDACNEDGLTALHQCCIDNSEEMVRLLVEHGANVDARDSELWTPLHAAATCGHVNLCRYLIEHNADILAVNADCNMPYDICEDELTLDYIESEMAKRGITQSLIDELRLSREKTMLDDLQKLAEESGDLEYKGRQGETPLHIAAANGYFKVAEFLLNHNVVVDCPDNDTWQPIHCAACWGQLQVLELLLEHGASLNAKTRNNETPIDICEDAELRERIEEIRVAFENSRNAREEARKLKTHRPSMNARSASIRRTSMREKKALSWKEAREEGQKFRESATSVADANDEEDEDGKIAGNNNKTSEKVRVNKVESASRNGGDTNSSVSQSNASQRPDGKVEIIPKSILSTSKNGHAAAASSASVPPSSSDPTAKYSLSERRPTTFVPSSAESPTDDGQPVGNNTSDSSVGGLADLKRQRAQMRNSTISTSSKPSTNGDAGSARDESSSQLKRFSSAGEVIDPDDNNNRSCCTIV